MQQIVEFQRDFFNAQATKSIDFRIKKLKQFETMLKQNEQLLFDAIYKDFKKSEFDTFMTELSLVYHDIAKARKKLRQWASHKTVRTNLVNFPAKSYIKPEPLGVCLVIGAWNYPYVLSFGPVVGAMAAGCTIVLNPSELPKNTSAIMAKIVSETFDNNYFAVIEGGVEETTELLRQKFDKIFFTGSTAVGKIVYKAAAENLTPVTLELGGKSPVFVTADCDLKMSVQRIIWGKFLNAGQTCLAPDYILVEKAIEQRFLEQCVKELKKREYSVDNGNYVQIIDDRNFKRLTGMFDKDKTYHGGSSNEANRTISPTILSDVKFSDPIMQEEIFGPILPVLSYEDVDDAIAKVKKLPRPLSCYVFTGSSKVKKKVIDQISFGGGCVNETVMQITNSNLPFGGVGRSGMGAYHGEAGFKAFSHFKSMIDKPTWFELNLKYYPYSKSKLWWIQKFFNF